MEEISGIGARDDLHVWLPLDEASYRRTQEPISNLGLCSTRGTREPLANIAPCSARAWVLVSVRSGCACVPGLGGRGRTVSRVMRGHEGSCGGHVCQRVPFFTGP